MSKSTNQTDVRQAKYVSADEIARHYSCTGRYILKLAAEGRIPSLRLGAKCIRFDLQIVEACLKGGLDCRVSEAGASDQQRCLSTKDEDAVPRVHAEHSTPNA